MSEKKSERREAMFYTQKNGYDKTAETEQIEAYSRKYMEFLDEARTERLAVRAAIRMAEKKGFVPLEPDVELKPGAKVYKSNRGKALMLAVIGEKSLSEGAVIAAAHVDSPRLDLKQVPLYEDSELSFLKTHYYGGIKKYQWLAIPLELHGVVVKPDLTSVDIAIGQDKNDPVFTITDLLPHLAADQYKKSLSDAISGEGLNLLSGSKPDEEEGADRVKLAIMSILNEKYDITEEDFLSAELSAVPALPTREVGLDRSMIGGYGHDDRVCSYAALEAIFDCGTPDRTAVCVLADKEEIGSEGTSGMKSEAFELFMEELTDSQGVKLSKCFEKSLCISADVNNGFDPNYPEVSERRNSAKLNYGVGITKYTGRAGKSGSNDADAETIAYLRRVFAKNDVIWQTAELGKVDQGGGGTVAMLMSQRNIDTIDAGVPVLSMHSPYEVVSKLDCYMTYKAIRSIFADSLEG